MINLDVRHAGKLKAMALIRIHISKIRLKVNKNNLFNPKNDSERSIFVENLGENSTSCRCSKDKIHIQRVKKTDKRTIIAKIQRIIRTTTRIVKYRCQSIGFRGFSIFDDGRNDDAVKIVCADVVLFTGEFE